MADRPGAAAATGRDPGCGRWAAIVVGLLSLAVSPVAGSATDRMQERVRACDACHGEDRIEVAEGYVPRIRGKPAGYLFNQLVNYREHRRRSRVMNYLVRNLSDEYLYEIAAYFATREAPYPAPAPAPADDALLERGKRLARVGDVDAGIPACQACHGERLTGVEPTTPGLIGLPRHYISAQLGTWRVGTRRAAPPDCMATIAERMSQRDIRAVSAWLASRALPEQTRPAPRLAQDPPLECGSVPPPER